MKQDIVELKHDVGELKHKVSNIERNMAVAAVKAKNALLGPMDTILKLPLPNGIVTETEYPPTRNGISPDHHPSRRVGKRVLAERWRCQHVERKKR
jgi:hypothetical protein